MAIAVDTNVLVRWLVRDHKILADQACAIIDTAKAQSLEVDRLILAELTYVLRSNYEMPKDMIVDNLRAIMASGVFLFRERELTQAAVSVFAAEAPLSFEDSWLLAQKRTGNVSSIATFDKALDRRQ